jgi:putative inorganic carbon (HCO3(-)) transporter
MGHTNWIQRLARGVADWELVLLAAATPLLLFPTHWTPLAVAAVVFLWLCRWVATGRPSVATPADGPLVLLLGMAVVGLWVSVDRSASLPALWRSVLGVAIFYGLANSALGTAAWRRRLPAMLMVASLGLIVLTLFGTAWDQVRLFNLPQLYARLPTWLRDVQDHNAFNPRLMGMALATWLPLPLALLLFGRGAAQRLWAAGAVLLMLLTILVSQSLQAAVGVGCAVLFLGLCWSRWFVLSVPLLAGGVLLSLRDFGLQRAATVALSMDNSLGIAAVLRLDIWSRAVAMIRDMPYTGIGLDMFQTLQWHFYPGVTLGTEPHAHNLFLQVALDLGLPGLFALLWLLGALGWAAARAYRRCADAQGRALLLGAVASILSYLGCGLLDTLWAAKPAVLLWVVLGLLAVVTGSMLRLDHSPAALQDTDAPAARSVVGPKLSHGGAQAHSPLGALGHRLVRCGRQVLPLTIPLLLLFPGLLLPRNAFDVNRSLIPAHQVLLPAERGESPSLVALAPVAQDLRRVAAGADNAHLCSLLGQSEGWLGDYDLAVEALERRIELDARDPIATYAPFEGLRRRIAGESAGDRWEDTAWLYSFWMTRFPQRAEAYVLLALADQRRDKPQAAAQVLRSALQNGAQPRCLLAYALAQLNTGTQ